MASKFAPIFALKQQYLQKAITDIEFVAGLVLILDFFIDFNSIFLILIHYFEKKTIFSLYYCKC